jgi:hypothetical protein
MTVIELGLLIFLAGICAGLAQFITGATRGGCPVSVGTAFIGGYVGPRIAEWFGWAEPFTLRFLDSAFPVVTSAVGAVGLAVLVNIITHGRRY